MAGLPSLLETAFHGWTSLDGAIQRELARTRSLLRLAPPPKPSNDVSADLARMIEAQIIPRLMLAHQPPELEPEREGAKEVELACVLRLALDGRPDSLSAYLDGRLERGWTPEQVCLELLAPTARAVGVLWEEDAVSFTDVTIALGRLQQALRAMGAEPEREREDEANALFVPAPGEQHTFGLFVVEDCFRRAGWRTFIDTGADERDCAELVATRWFDVVGVTASASATLETVTRGIDMIRAASANPSIFVLVGGQFFSDPGTFLLVGADAAADTGGEALLIADKAVRRLLSA